MATSGPGTGGGQPTGGGPGGSGPSGLPSWTGNITSREAVPGPAGLYYADVPNRIIAYIIDAIIIGIIGFIISLVLNNIVPVVQINPRPTSFADLVTLNPVGVLVQGLVGLALSAGYFIFTWTNPGMRGSVGMKVLGMQVGNESDGATLTLNQAVIRWILLGAPFGIAQMLSGILGVLVVVVAIIWFIALLVTTAQSPTKQGLHDRYAHSVVVKAGRSVS